jgi:hypothetical protein
VLPHHAADAVALAPAAGRRRVDLSASPSRTPTAGRRHAAADRPPGHGESPLGLSAHPRRAAPAWHAGVSDRDPHDLAPPWAGSCPTAGEHQLARIPATASCRDPRPATSLPSTPSGCGGCMYCSSSSWIATVWHLESPPQQLQQRPPRAETRSSPTGRDSPPRSPEAGADGCGRGLQRAAAPTTQQVTAMRSRTSPASRHRGLRSRTPAFAATLSAAATTTRSSHRGRARPGRPSPTSGTASPTSR